MSDRDRLGKPLKTVDLTKENIDPDLMEEVGRRAVAAIKAEIRRTTFQSSPTELANSFKYEIKNGILSITSDHPAAEYLNDGVRPYQMTHLTKARRPIPILLDNGEVIFRSATKESMQEGKWRHPGFSGKNFIERGVAKAMGEVRSMAVENVKAKVRARFRGMVSFSKKG